MTVIPHAVTEPRHLRSKDTGRERAAERLSFEWRRTGAANLALPPLLVVFGIICLVIQHLTHSPLGKLAGSWVDAVLPLGAAISAAMLVGADSALELQLSLPTAYRRTLAWRMSICVAWTAVVDFTFAAVVELSGIWPVGFAKAEVAWIVSTAVLVAFGVLFAGLFGDGRTGAVAAGGLWVAEEGLKDWFESHMIGHPLFLFAASRFGPGITNYWLNRLSLAIVALVLALLAWTVLGHGHRLFKRAD